MRRPLESAQYTSIRYTSRLAEAGAHPSVGSVGDSYDNALAESLIGTYKSEVIRRDGPWRGHADLELATGRWVAWYNAERLHQSLDYRTPAEVEAEHYRHNPAPAAA